MKRRSSSLDFASLIDDIKNQPNWRADAQTAANYYDGLQISEKRRDALDECEQLDIVGNLIQPAINAVLGFEEKRRTDFMLMADNNDTPEDVVEALNAKLNDIAHLSGIHRAISDAYKSMITKGVGALYIEKTDGIFTPKIIAEEIHLDDLYWDMRSRDPWLRDCKFVMRRKWMDYDDVIDLFHDEAELIENVANGWEGVRYDENKERLEEFHANTGNIEWIMRGTTRKRIAVSEVYYRSNETREIVLFAGGAAYALDADNIMQAFAIKAGLAKITKQNVPCIRRKIFIGAHEVLDEESPHGHDHFPIVIFFGYREDASNIPYGIVRSMIDPQDAYNEAGFEIHRILDHIRVIKEETATDMRDSELIHELRRRDGIITTRDGRLGGIIVQKDWAELQALNGLQDKYAAQIREFSGIYSQFMGRDHSQQSGVSIASLVELTAGNLSEINANYEAARRLVGEILLFHLLDDMRMPDVTVKVKKGKTFTLNSTPLNNVFLWRFHVRMADVASSASYRQHLHMRVTQMFQVAGADPLMMRFLLRLAIQTSELPDRERILSEWDALMQMQMQPQANPVAEAEAARIAALAEQHSTQAELNKIKAAAEVARIEAERARTKTQESIEKQDLIHAAKNQITRAA